MHERIPCYWKAGNRIGGMAVLFCVLFSRAQTPQSSVSARDLIIAMTAREREASNLHERFSYLSNERSERTEGHLWTERVVETGHGHVHILMAEDGKPLSPERAKAERVKLAGYAAHPEIFAQNQNQNKPDDMRTRGLLEKMPNGFLLENVRLENGIWHIDFRPDPAYSPSGLEDRVLHGMSGSMAIDAKQLRLVHLNGRVTNKMNFGFGLLATLQAGSSFAVDKQDVDGTWRAVHLSTDIRGKALMVKAISRNSEWNRTEFQHLDPNLTIAQAVVLAQRSDIVADSH